MRRLILLCALAMTGCVDGTGTVHDVPLADMTMFIEVAQPVLAARCANPGCHGDVARPLQVFASRRHRLDPADNYINEPLTLGELERNYANACGFLVGVDAAEQSLLLRKTLPAHLGGVHHEGGVIFEDTDEPDYLALRAWVGSAFGGPP